MYELLPNICIGAFIIMVVASFILAHLNELERAAIEKATNEQENAVAQALATHRAIRAQRA